VTVGGSTTPTCVCPSAATGFAFGDRARTRTWCGGSLGKFSFGGRRRGAVVDRENRERGVFRRRVIIKYDSNGGSWG
jgi:hypothetical protein